MMDKTNFTRFLAIAGLAAVLLAGMAAADNPTAPTGEVYRAAVTVDADGNIVWPPPLTNLLERVTAAETGVVDVAADVAALTVKTAGGYRNPLYWRVEIEPRYRIVDTASTNTVDDVTQVDYTAGDDFLDAQALIDWRRGWTDDGLSWSIAPTNLAAIDAETGYITTASTGVATVTAEIDGLSKTAPVYLRRVAGDAWASWIEGVTNTVRRAAGDKLDDAIEAIEGEPDTLLFSTMDHGAGVYEWNTNAWTWGLADLSGVVISSKRPGSGWGNAQWHGTLISPRHIELPKHCIYGVPNQVSSQPEQVGTQKRFLGQDGTLYTREVIAHYDPFGDPTVTNLTDWSWGQDTIIGLLDAPLPTNNVAVYPVLPPDWRDYSPTLLRARASEPGSVSEGGAAGGLWTNLDRRVYGVEFSTTSGFQSTPWPPRASVHRLGRAGDSGRPVFLWLPDQLVLMFTLTFPSSGHNWAALDPDSDHPSNDYRERIEAILALEGESLIDADLSEFTNFEGGE